MPQTSAMMIYLFLALFSLSFLPWTSTGFTLQLIHRDSPLSPLYQSNLSDIQRFIKNADISMARASYFQQQNELTGNTNSSTSQKLSIRVPLLWNEPLYTVEIGIGTPAVKTSLIFDTASGLTWTRCYKQRKGPFFDTKKSKSYKALTKAHPLSKNFKCGTCRGCIPLFGCRFSIKYQSGQSTAGNAATETLTFYGSSRSSATVPNYVFGCATSNSGTFPPNINGIIGFDKEAYSFTQQVGGVIRGRFSYCMTPTSTPSYLRFGDNAVIRGGKTTPFGNNYKQSNIQYVLNLNGVSIGGIKVGLGPNAFPDGCLIDSGAAVSVLHERAFFAVRAYFENYFSKFNVRRHATAGGKMKAFVCFEGPQGFDNIPGMTFNFQGADYQIPPSNLFFFIETNVFCLAMIESKDMSILGAFQQRNVRVMYDLIGKMISFAPEDCSRDTP